MNANKYYTIAEIGKAATKYKYLAAELTDEKGKKIFGMAANTKPATWLTQKVAPWMERPETQHGTYWVNMYGDTKKNMAPASYAILVGDPGTGSTTPPSPVVYLNLPENKNQKLSEPNTFLTHEQYLEMQKQILNLETENARLKVENESLLDKLDELEEEKEEKGLLGDKGTSFIGDLVPVFDKYFDHSRRQQELQFLTLSQGNPALMEQFGQRFLSQPGAQQNNPQLAEQQRQAQEYEAQIQKANKFFDQLDDETFDAIKVLRNEWASTGDRDIRNFYAMIEKEYPEVYDQLYEFVYGGAQ